MTRKELVLVALLAAGVVTLAAQAETPVSYAKDIEPIFVKECGKCHGGDNPKKGLDLSDGKGYAQLVGVDSVEEPKMARVKAGDPAGSYLWLKLTHTASKGRGMPRTLFGAKKLPQSDLDLVQKWITQGANP
jgi:mono/diheme cytochrome c family protein